MATRGENSELLVSLTLQDNLSGPMKAAKANVDAAAQSSERLGNSIEAAGGKLRTFRRIGSEVGQVGRALGGEFQDATNAADNFITTAGSAGLAIRGIAEVAPVAATAVGALGLTLAAVAAPLAVIGVGLGAFVVAAQRVVTPIERAQTAIQTTQTRVDLLDRALKAGQLTPEAYAQRLALIRPPADAASQALADLTQREIDQSAQAAHLADEMAGLTPEVIKLKDAFLLLGTSVDSQDIVDTVAAAQQGVGAFADLAGNVEATGTAGSKTADQLDRIVGDIAFLSEHAQLQIKINVAAAGSGVGLIPGGTPDTFVAGNTDIPPPSEGNLPFGSSNAKVIADAAAAAAKAAAEAARLAAERARELAAAYHDRVEAAFNAAKRTADTLFDALHRRNLQAIDDSEKLAQTRHDNTAQAIADQLKLEQASHAAPVLAAQQALNDRQAIQQRRDLVEAQQDAANALAKNTDPANTQGLARALRAATEALQNFDASATIGRLQDIQAQQDAASEERARVAAGINDAELAAAKQAADIARDAETIADQKRRQRFDLELAALQKRDEALKKSPAAIQQDIEALQAKFGITIDPITGFHHITDPLVTAIKNVKIEPPKVTVNNNQQFFLRLGANDLKLIASAIQATAQPAATASARTGNARG